MSETININIIRNEVAYLTGKHGFDAMAKRMTDKYKLSSSKDGMSKEGTVYGIKIKIYCGKPNNRKFKKVSCHDDKTVIFKM
jgi:hypothetical protein